MWQCFVNVKFIPLPRDGVDLLGKNCVQNTPQEVVGVAKEK